MGDAMCSLQETHHLLGQQLKARLNTLWLLKCSCIPKFKHLSPFPNSSRLYPLVSLPCWMFICWVHSHKRLHAQKLCLQVSFSCRFSQTISFSGAMRAVSPCCSAWQSLFFFQRKILLQSSSGKRRDGSKVIDSSLLTLTDGEGIRDLIFILFL